MTGYIGNIEELVIKNNHFRQVLYTGVRAQLVVMSLLPGEDIGVETHGHVDQFFRIEAGTIEITMNGQVSTLTAGMAAIVPAGTKHNLVNIGTSVAKMYTLYSPPNHPANTVHPTKADAMRAE
ncbi:cupin domain-containing protein [Candidatus Woesebacteria bacterium]|nr:cupin domain-containing protein [Candidatus Woesebacteria bacterium]